MTMQRSIMQRLCHQCAFVALFFAVAFGAVEAEERLPANNYPTLARVEFVQECISKHGERLASLYQCSCAIDRIADKLTYDDFVEAATYSKYSGLPGEGGGIFRDSDQAKKMSNLYREHEADAYRTCGIGT